MAFSLLKENKIFLLIVLVVFAVYLFMALQPVEFLLKNFIVDDAFYYFKTASNIAGGLGATFDGEHPTNGYHPLWMGIAAAIYYLIPNNLILPLNIILIISVFLFLAASLLVWDTVLKITKNKFIASVLAVIYIFNPWNIRFYMSGLETPLTLFLFVLFFRELVKCLGEESKPRNFLVAGLVGGLMVLSRLDYGLFLAAGFILLAVKTKKDFWKNMILFSAPAFLVTAPWFLYNYFKFGSFFPASGLAYTMINHRLWFYKAREWWEVLRWSVFNFFGTVALNLRILGLPIFYSSNYALKSMFYMGAVFLPLLAIISYCYFKSRQAFKDFWNRVFGVKEWPAFIYLFAAFTALVFVHGAVRWSGRDWYFSTFPIFAVILIAILLGEKEDGANVKKWGILILVFCFVLYNPLSKNLFSAGLNQVEMYKSSLWVRDNVPASARIAAFNSGIHGYFSGHFVMNSDGLINNSAYEAMRQNRLWDLFKLEKIDYILDYEVVLTYRYKSFFGIDDPMSKVKKIDLSQYVPMSGNYGGSHVNLYKLPWSKIAEK
ncbi:MAG: hypothetical protein PHP03_03615 [Candidatus Pacebacteria bacterium]|nr:hypothetical protein [Candidatus Paceibacterota bacterium]